MRVLFLFVLSITYFYSVSQGVTLNSAASLATIEYGDNYLIAEDDILLNASAIESGYVYWVYGAGFGAFISNQDELGVAVKLELGVELNEEGSVNLLFTLGMHAHEFEGEDDIDWLFIPNLEVKPASFLGLRAGYARVHVEEEYVRVNTLNGIYGALVLGGGTFRIHAETVFAEGSFERLSVSLVSAGVF